MPLRHLKAEEPAAPDTGAAPLPAATAIALVAAAPLLYFALAAWASGYAPQNPARTVQRAAQQGWLEGRSGGWEGEFIGADQNLYLVPRQWPEAALHVARYDRQTQGKKLTGSQNTAVAPAWRIESRTPVPGRDAVELVLRGTGSQHRLVWYWYDVGGRTALRPLAAKGWLLWARLKGREDSAQLALSLPCQADCAQEREVLATLVTPARDLYRALYAEP